MHSDKNTPTDSTADKKVAVLTKEGKWAELDKEGVRDEWSKRGLGGQDPQERDAVSKKELTAISRRLTINHIASNMPQQDARVLEIGCGWGRIMTGVKEQFPGIDYIGIDITPNLIELAKEQIQHFKLQQPCTVQVGDAENLPFPEDNFDLVYSSRVFQYLPNVQNATNEAHRVLKPGGRLIVILPNRHNPKRKSYHTPLPWPREIRDWFHTAGFESLQTTYFGFMPTVRYEPIGFMDRAVEVVARIPWLRKFGSLVLVTGIKPKRA